MSYAVVTTEKAGKGRPGTESRKVTVEAEVQRDDAAPLKLSIAVKISEGEDIELATGRAHFMAATEMYNVLGRGKASIGLIDISKRQKAWVPA